VEFKKGLLLDLMYYVFRISFYFVLRVFLLCDICDRKLAQGTAHKRHLSDKKSHQSVCLPGSGTY